MVEKMAKGSEGTVPFDTDSSSTFIKQRKVQLLPTTICHVATIAWIYTNGFGLDCTCYTVVVDILQSYIPYDCSISSSLGPRY